MIKSTNNLSIIRGGGVTHSCRTKLQLSLFAFIFFTALHLIFSATSFALETQGGDSCVGIPTGATRITGGPENNGVSETLVCNGTIWEVQAVGGGIDDDPNAFSFTDQTDVLLGTLITSNEVTITGIDPLAVVSVSGDGNPEMSVNGGAWTNASSVILEGHTLSVRLTSNATPATANVAIVTIGDATDNWSVTTTTADTTPIVFSFTDQTGQPLSTLRTSNSINIGGINISTPVSVSGQGNPQIRINGGSWVTSGNITNGQSLEVRLATSASYNTAFTATVDVGGVTDNWSVTTVAECSSVGEICIDGSVYVTATLRTTPSDLSSAQGASLPGPWGLFVNDDNYPSECSSLVAHGHSDWRGATTGEMGLLYTNRVVIGGFNGSIDYFTTYSDTGPECGDIMGTPIDEVYRRTRRFDTGANRTITCCLVDCSPDGFSTSGRCVRTP